MKRNRMNVPPQAPVAQLITTASRFGVLGQGSPKRSLPPEPSLAPAGPAGTLHMCLPTHSAFTFATVSFSSQLPFLKLLDVPTAPVHEPSGVPQEANSTSPMLNSPQLRWIQVGGVQSGFFGSFSPPSPHVSRQSCGDAGHRGGQRPRRSAARDAGSPGSVTPPTRPRRHISGWGGGVGGERETGGERDARGGPCGEVAGSRGQR